MASGKILRQLFRAGTSGDSDAFRLASESIIQEERQKQHHLLANDLEKILYGSSPSASNGKLSRLVPAVPTDKERGLPLLDVRHPQRTLDELILAKNGYTAIEELIEEHRRQDILRSYGMRPSSRVLFFGPPGCGKTLAAEVIAYELDLPLAVVRLDALVSSFLGETAANLRKVFDFISQYPMVALFDEFDALGKERSGSDEHGELRRVVNAVLQMMDAYQGQSLIIAATNHEQILDSAIWRRFEDLIEFSLPAPDLIVHILQLKLRGVRRQFDLDDSSVIAFFQGVSGADIERVARKAIKRMILKGQEFLSVKDLKNAYDKDIKR
ncbi:ATP-binding protein [Nitrosospira sp. NRS527]|uniref:AAA family ATPase n=1 Tax=Nitrosospira sp. NRS527 TaxID=155925 RepID=UPI001AF31A5E|nr:ATP-binding protein [Nitrosospira sp. NRS527]BCT69562.1 ATP-dependent zinc metalloprotease FtsH [Nitrosospira sp. NRS527]